MKPKRKQKSKGADSSLDRVTDFTLTQARLRFMEHQLDHCSYLSRRGTGEGADPEDNYAELQVAHEQLQRRLIRLSPPRPDDERFQLIQDARQRAGPQPTADYPHDGPPVYGLTYNDRVHKLLSIYSGCVSVPPMSEFATVSPSEPGNSGTINTAVLYSYGGVQFNADLTAPEQSPGNPSVWLHAWKTVIEFPRFSAYGFLDYHLTVRAECFVSREGSNPTLQCYSTVGESSNYQPGRNIPGEPDKCLWPLDVDLRSALPGGYGEVDSSVMAPTVHRGTIALRPGRTAALSLTIGVIAIQPGGRLRILWGNYGPEVYGPHNVECVTYRFEPTMTGLLTESAMARVFTR